MFNKLKIYISEEEEKEVILKVDIFELAMIEKLSAEMIYQGKKLKEMFHMVHNVEDTEDYCTIILRTETINYIMKKINEWENGLLY